MADLRNKSGRKYQIKYTDRRKIRKRMGYVKIAVPAVLTAAALAAGWWVWRSVERGDAQETLAETVLSEVREETSEEQGTSAGVNDGEESQDTVAGEKGTERSQDTAAGTKGTEGSRNASAGEKDSAGERDVSAAPREGTSQRKGDLSLINNSRSPE